MGIPTKESCVASLGVFLELLRHEVMLRAEVAPVTPSALSFVSPNKVQGETLRALSACAGGS